ncbi:hypothetical protein V490_05945 [Pseudogymnoascus sp. VKM F-3557]|nr:hypothetical protein V490_05945 [Pseudogymnoascus sp. VKM F-3557]
MTCPPPSISGRRFGRSFECYNTLSSANVGAKDIGKVKVDCRFRLSKSKWGVLGNAERPVGIVYLDLNFDQPKDCRLSSATVLVTLDDEIGDEERDRRRQVAIISQGGSLQMTDYFGPKQLSGKTTTVHTKSTYRFTPEFNVMGNGIGGLGKDKETTRLSTGRWTFTGKLQSGETAAYRALKWELSENELDLQSQPRSIFHTGFIFEHTLRPCYMRVEITGKLQRTRDYMRSMKFPAPRPKKQGETVVRIDLGPQHRCGDRLDSLADSLAMAMEMENCEEISVEVSEAMPAVYQEVGNQQGPLGATSNSAPPLLSGAPMGRIDNPPVQPQILSAPIAEDPLREALARAHLSFPLPDRIRPRAPESMSASSAETLVEVEERDEEIPTALQDEKTGEPEMENESKEAGAAMPAVKDVVKSEKELATVQRTIIQISEQFPVMMFIIYAFFNFLGLFLGKQTLIEKEV